MSNDNQATGHNLDTSDGARAYVAEFFANQVRRHDFRAYITTRLAADFACALAKHLAAQPSPTDTGIPTSPSPAGQGDALLESLVVRWRAEAAGAATIDNTLCQKIANCTMRHAAELTDALAARQPAGQQPVAWLHAEDPSRVISASQKATALRDQGASGSSVRPYSVPAYLQAPPAQAVELRQFRECVELMEWQERGHSNPDWPVGDPKKHAEALRLLALIDSQAVRNG